ncbi:unannotated protein [freshwater metagenome]|uniref:Unannotated protein n=1 Tax=freshwater metagenome TaxID=449393 RepID=A0A6J7ILN1_9ZZZZ
MNARRTDACGRAVAAATASTMMPSSAPCLSSPVTNLMTNARSSAVVRENKSSSRAERRAAEPAPDVAATSDNFSSTSATVSVDTDADGTSRSASVRQPTPIRPCGNSPDNHDTAGAISPACASDSTAPSSSILTLRERVAATAREVSTILDISTHRT